MLDCIVQSSPFAASKRFPTDNHESFTLTHACLQLCNILVDEQTGEVTGIIGWDRASTLPRCVGHTIVPNFLGNDWNTYYTLGPELHLSSWNLKKYRGVYTRAMKDACGGTCADAQFTEKSGLYSGIQTMLFKSDSNFGTNFEAMLDRMLLELAELRRVGIPIGHRLLF